MGKGYKAGYMALQGDFVMFKSENVGEIPKELNLLFYEMERVCREE